MRDAIVYKKITKKRKKAKKLIKILC